MQIKTRMTRVIRFSLFTALAALLAFAGANAVQAQAEGTRAYFPIIFRSGMPTNTPAVSFLPNRGPAGVQLAVSGARFAANTALQVGIAQPGVTPTSFINVTTNASGAFTAMLTVPTGALPGTQWVVQARTAGGPVPAEADVYTVEALPMEAIHISQPAPGSRVTSPIRVMGIADPTFEQNLVVRIVRADGTQVALTSTTIQGEIGERGAFDVNVPVSLTQEDVIFIQVYAESARDGGVTHLSSTSATFTPTGPALLLTQAEAQERVAILYPRTGHIFSGGLAHIAGFGLASFEQTLLVEVLDEDGTVVGSQSVTVNSPGLGQPGSFHTTIAYPASAAGAGRIVVRDISPAFGGNTHLTSVEVQLRP